jgi:hypothetical protein
MTQPAISTIPSGSAVSLTTATPANITSMPLAAGTYLVWGRINATLTGATLTALAASLSLASSAIASQPGAFVSPGRLFPEPFAQQLRNLTTASGTDGIDITPTVFTVTPGMQATLYLVGQATFSAGSVAAYGSVFALPLPN